MKKPNAKWITYQVNEKVGFAYYIADVTIDKWQGRIAKFKCSFCDREFECHIKNVKDKRRISCGCLKPKLQARRHTSLNLPKPKSNKKYIPEYAAWNAMKRRCYTVTNGRYENYGGRGIEVCDRWRNSYKHFLEDMGPRPTDKHSLDRINPNGHYEPSNCRWADIETQSNNKAKTKLYTYNGKTQTLAQWIREIKRESSNLK